MIVSLSTFVACQSIGCTVNFTPSSFNLLNKKNDVSTDGYLLLTPSTLTVMQGLYFV